MNRGIEQGIASSRRLEPPGDHAPTEPPSSRRNSGPPDGQPAGLARVPLAWLIAGASAAAVGLVLATRTSFYWADDWMNFAQARQLGLGYEFLKSNVYEELAPGHRFLDWLLGVQLGLHWGWAMAIFMLCWLVGVVAFAFVADALFRSRWAVVIATALFASAPGFVRIMQWSANAEHEMPSIALTLVALAASLRWLRVRRWPWLAAAALAYLAALLFYAKPILLLLYLVLLAYFVPSRLTNPGISVRQLRSDLPLLGALVAISVLYVIAVRVGGYLQVQNPVSAGTWIHFFALDWFEGVTPWLIGQSSVPSHAGVGVAVDVLAQVALAVVVIGSLARSRSAWRAWAFYLIVWLANAAIVGAGRLGTYGPGMGFDPRYNAELAYLLPLTIGLAYSAPIERQLLPVTRVRAWLAWPRIRIAAGTAAAVLIAGYGASVGVSYARISSSWAAGDAGKWVANVEASVARLRHQGINPSVIDARVPQTVYPGLVDEYTQLSSILPLLDDRIVVDDQTGRDPPAIVAPDGTVHLATGRVLVGGPAPAEVRSRILTPVPGVLASIRGDAYCARPASAIGMLQFRPPKHVNPKLGVIEIALDPNRARGVLFVYADTGGGYGAYPIKMFHIHANDAILRAELPAGPLAKARLDLQPQSAACIRSVKVVDYSVTTSAGGGR